MIDSTRVALNCDLGELPDEPEALYALVDIANVACGGHVGDVASMRLAVSRANAGGARVYAHPAYPDRAGFGRQRIDIDATVLDASIAAQLSALLAVVRDVGGAVEGVKPHGALYHDLHGDPAMARRFVATVEETMGNVTIVGPPDGALASAAAAAGLAYLREGFVDRRYRDGRLVPRHEPDALLVDVDACVAQAVALSRAGTYDTLCAHSDTPGVVARLEAVRRAILRQAIARRAIRA